MYVHITLQQPLACISTKDGWCVHVHVQSYMYMYRNTCICVTTSEKNYHTTQVQLYPPNTRQLTELNSDDGTLAPEQNSQYICFL